MTYLLGLIPLLLSHRPVVLDESVTSYIRGCFHVDSLELERQLVVSLHVGTGS